MCKKPTANLVPISERSAKYLASLYTYAQSRQSLRSACEGIYCKYFKPMCETLLILWYASTESERPAKVAQMFVLIWKSPINEEPFCEILVLNSCVSSIGSNQPTHMCSLGRAFTACTQCTYSICTYMQPFLTCRRNYPESFSPKFWFINIVSARTECACENAWMVKHIWAFTGYTSVTHLHMRTKYLLHEWPNKAHVILSRYGISPEPSNRTYRLCVKPFFTFVTLCLLCNFSYFCWRLLAYFKFNFFLSILIWVHADCIGCQLSLILSHAPQKIYVDEGSGQTLWEFCIIAYASS